MPKKPEAAATPAVSIVSRQPGFRRAGIAHPDRAEYPAGFFTAEQLEMLQAEPKLVVTITGPAPAETA